MADRFAVIALAGEMAIAYGLLPWPVGTALGDSMTLYGEWLDRVGSGNAEDRQILGSIAGFIERHGDSRSRTWTRAIQRTRPRPRRLLGD